MSDEVTLVIPARNAIPLADHVSFEDAAAFPLATLTAWNMIVRRARFPLLVGD